MQDDPKQESSPPQVRKLIELVAYQDGAVVSRQLVARKTGTVTLFAFDRGQQLSEHTAPFDALVQVLEGEAQVEVSGQPYHLKPGEMLSCPPTSRMPSGQ